MGAWQYTTLSGLAPGKRGLCNSVLALSQSDKVCLPAVRPPAMSRLHLPDSDNPHILSQNPEGSCALSTLRQFKMRLLVVIHGVAI